MSSLRRSSRLAAAASATAAVAEEKPATRSSSGRVSKAPTRFTEEVFKELPMANNKYTKGRRIAPGFSIERESTDQQYVSADEDTMEVIKDSVRALKTASAEEALEILDEIMDDVREIVEAAPENEDLNDALCLFYNAYENAEELAESNNPDRLLRKVYKEAYQGYKLLAENIVA